MDLSTIIKHIQLEKKRVIYLGIGTAAGLRTADGSLLPQNYHQYPPFLQDLKNSGPDMSLSLLLIDPNQENPPYMVKDKGLIPKVALANNNNNIIINIIDNNNNNNNNPTDIYTSPDQTLTLYTLRANVYMEPFQRYNDTYINITDHLRELNTYAIAHNVLFIFHDFTGRKNQLLAEYFDGDLREHLDHIVYGLGLREDFGCYFDLTDPCSYHPFYRTATGALKLFNPYYYIVNDKLNLMLANNTMLSDTTIINKHMEKLLFIVKQDVNNVTLQALRVVFRLIMGEEVKEFDKEATEYKYFSLEKRTFCLQMCRERSYGDLYDYLLTEFGKKLDIVATIKGLDITGREILEFITLGDDPFKWYDNVKNFI
jgi:hypothetical protein